MKNRSTKKSRTARQARAKARAAHVISERDSARHTTLKSLNKGCSLPPEAHRIRPEQVEDLLAVCAHDLNEYPENNFPVAFLPEKGPPVYHRLDILKWLRTKVGWAAYLDMLNCYDQIARDREIEHEE